jgi:hypothetical protein
MKPADVRRALVEFGSGLQRMKSLATLFLLTLCICFGTVFAAETTVLRFGHFLPEFGNTQDITCRTWLAAQGFKIDAVWTVEPWVSRLELEQARFLLWTNDRRGLVRLGNQHHLPRGCRH